MQGKRTVKLQHIQSSTQPDYSKSRKHRDAFEMDVLVSLINNPIFDQIVTHVLGRQDLKITKQLLLIARHMGLAEGWGNFRDLTVDAARLLIDLPIFQKLGEGLGDRSHVVLAEEKINEFFENPLYTGAVIMATCLNPMSKDEVEKERLASFLKEISVMDTLDYAPSLNYGVFFGQHDEPLHSDILPNPKMAKIVHDAIDTWIYRVEDRVHPPTMSKKCLPTFTRQELHRYIDILVEDPAIATPASLERLYVKEGIFLDGPCEMSQRWYTTKLTPRTYFVAGPTAYNDTKYTKWMWNELVDCLSVTHKRNRVNPRRVFVDGCKEALFYDLTSFTSNMGTQKYFIEALATYCQSRNVQIMDSYYGPTTVNLGELIRTYNTMNFFPEYRSDEFPSAWPDTHGVAGFLGVFGNIATCTFLHGAVLLQLCDSEHECGCAGDDAVICCQDDGKVYGCINLLGILAIEKTFSSRDIDVVYLKRRTWIDPRDFCLRSRQYVQIPSFLPWLDFRQEFRYTRESSLTRREKYDLAASSLQATFSSVSRLYAPTRVLEEIRLFLMQYYGRCHFPLGGNVPQFSSVITERTARFIPSLDVLGLREWVDQTLLLNYPGECYLPDRSEHMTWGIDGRKGIRFRAQGSEYLNFLCRLGFVEKKYKPRVRHVGEEGLFAVLNEFHARSSAWFVFEIVEDIPPNIRGGFQDIEGIYEIDWLPGFRHDAEVDE